MEKKLYEIADEMKGLQDQLDAGLDAGNVNPELIAQELETISIALPEKIENICKIIASMEGDIEARKAEADRLSKGASSMTKQVKWFKDYIRDTLVKVGRPKLKTALFNITVSNSKPSVNILNLEALPKEYLVSETTISPDKKKIYDDLNSGKAVPGATLQTSTSLRIN